MGNAAAQAAARRDREYSEYGSVAAIATMNPLVDEAVGYAYTKNGAATISRETGAQGPASVAIDRDGDGKSEMTLSFSRTFFGNTDKVAIDSRGKATAERSAGQLVTLDCDLNGDGRQDLKITVNRSFWNGITSVDVDTNGDGKPDHKLTPDTGFWGTANGMYVDLGNDGTNDGYIKFQRNGWGNIDKLLFQKKP